ncbi:shikimate kinase [Veillonella parvula DSM 2008]|uniref:shikimate kinase n=1 Tax=Veillonella parvula TaxID=29466 RepID=UPI00019C043D|nr:shikimate kinase [Veillonella parvula]ACZ25291.1 shikimate kinase [Veillonella parvula DSM 2008]QQB17249.1 AAA family ATPase [Veillonella parvula]SNV01517.1 Shikimate dehydrogenase [Veillonella parvula]
MKFGLLGRTLGHSFSPHIHNALGNTNYELFEREPSQLQEFFANPELQGINITFPYKVNALEACDVVDPRAERIGCVNTMVRKDGKWHGYNTDYDGFVFTLKHAGIDVSGKECIILGDGASSATVHVALEDLGAKSITHLSRKTAPLYTDAPNYYETAQIIINCTPIGMYPHNPANLIDIMQFSKLEGVVDLIYNPRRTVLLLQAEMMDIPHCDGLPFLVAQGVEAANHFQGESFDTKEIEQILRDMRREKENIILIGMPGVGKTTVGKAIGKEMGRTCIDVDQELAKEIGDISTYITEQGEAAFREKEADMIAKLGTQTGLVISTGGGCVTVPKNYAHLRQNGRIYQLTQPVEKLSTSGRVLSSGGIERLRELEETRTPMYESFAQCIVEHNRNAPKTVAAILEDFEANLL